jgi:hypothetical protein
MNNNIEGTKSVWRRVKRPGAATLRRIKEGGTGGTPHAALHGAAGVHTTKVSDSYTTHRRQTRIEHEPK